MLIPLKTDRPLAKPTRTTHIIIVVTVILFLLQLVLRNAEGALVGALVLARSGTGPWTYVTYAFLHDTGGVLHIIGNMLILFVFGPAVEDRFGRWRFLAFYLGGAVVAGVAHTLSSPAGVIGASGATAAVTGAFLVLFPRTRIRSLLFFGIITFLMVPAWFFVGLAVARDLFSLGLGSSRVAHEAHLGGYLFGAGLSFALLSLKLIPRDTYDLFSMFKQANRRRAFRDAAKLAPDAAGLRAADQRADGRVGPGHGVRAEHDEPDPEADRLAEARAVVSTALGEGRMDDAVARYRDLVDAYAEKQPSAATLSRGAQFTIPRASRKKA
ncbi:MAG: rhomboid family intramembrane serine protease [Planctomycetota bacterium]